MKKYLFIIFIFCLAVSMEAQNSNSYRIIRSSMGAAGSSKMISTDTGAYSISQSIGQTSVIGTHTKNSYYLAQGYQQPLSKIKVIKQSDSNDLTATIYPNPFEQSVAISFSEDIKNDISVSVFDISGKLLYSKIFSASQYLELNLETFSSGSYLLTAISNGKLFNAKLIKI